MSDPYARVKPGRLSFKGGTLATTSKTIDKKKKKKKNKNPNPNPNLEDETLIDEVEKEKIVDGEESSEYTIDAAKKMKYDQLFPVEAKKFGYEPKAKVTSVEDALDDRVKKKADRYCK
ncbi:hypothetical protein MtrunA17_Chr6g0464041 [Medicago truncatula]|uniref:Uncharacterized protein n=1 Tax=Medicago truncatula TaxID=3880 RepID=B7FH65_MEDTR|nr:uncharacterized protein LOC11416343 [Medicago truncatula]XP_039683136.1 uncharacterized protein LOC11416343 [Medicago truncatula]XP_039683137.1 uncharacterized protein LOC11416343 [Medicago truncatula]ACJ84094.1 unknown [Medicago truncatula]AES75290.2 hypothetical protein MTR_6g036570 [Medicago truncatula]AFK47734.1 unknown [Medicago truncatula]RHN51034.1 hypothetical protein MtrunA17_Chr6g0464041 [Medicago truncatula]